MQISKIIVATVNATSHKNYKIIHIHIQCIYTVIITYILVQYTVYTTK